MQVDMRGRTVLVTGSTDGIGKETALVLARMGANVLIHGRDEEKGRKVMEEIRHKSGNGQIELYIADLSSQRQVRKLAKEVLGSHDRLHVLINNAGVYMPQRRLTEDGIETTLAVNFLAPFLLTGLLQDLLKRSAPSRIINVSSVAHMSARVDLTDLQGERYYDGYNAYALSKLALILFTYSLAEKLRGTGVTVNCLHPGVINTKLLRAGFGPGGAGVEEGARTPVYLASSPDVENVTGKYFKDRRIAQSSPLTMDEGLQERFWKLGEKLTGQSLGAGR
ncbi:MAG TPA: SDR family oxidoreductase [Methanotrichaceae archaeon]|nr:SDR family oxidoreductase [Methanotrichaceae archaeon]